MKKKTMPKKISKKADRKADRDASAQSDRSATTAKRSGAHADHKPLNRGFEKIASRYSGGKPR